MINPELIEKLEAELGRPPVVCLCGSSRFKRAFIDVNARLTLQERQ